MNPFSALSSLGKLASSQFQRLFSPSLVGLNTAWTPGNNGQFTSLLNTSNTNTYYGPQSSAVPRAGNPAPVSGTSYDPFAPATPLKIQPPTQYPNVQQRPVDIGAAIQGGGLTVPPQDTGLVGPDGRPVPVPPIGQAPPVDIGGAIRSGGLTGANGQPLPVSPTGNWEPFYQAFPVSPPAGQQQPPATPPPSAQSQPISPLSAPQIQSFVSPFSASQPFFSGGGFYGGNSVLSALFQALNGGVGGSGGVGGGGSGGEDKKKGQAGGKGAIPTPWPYQDLDPLVRGAAAAVGIPYENLKAWIMQESSYGTQNQNAPYDAGPNGYLGGVTQQGAGPGGIFEMNGVKADMSTPESALKSIAELAKVLNGKYGSFDQAYGNYSAGEYSPQASKSQRADLYRARLK